MLDSMAAPSPARTVLFYRVLSLGLLAVMAVLGLALNRSVSERERLLQLASSRTQAEPARAAPTSVDAGPKEPGDVIRVWDLRGPLAQLNRATPADDQTSTLFDSPAGGLRIDVLSPRQRVPLHFLRTSHEVLLPVLGEQEIVYLPPKQGPRARPRLRPNTSTLVSFAAYTTHGVANLSSARASATLVFATAPHEKGRNVEDDDDRTSLGRPAEIVDAAATLAELRSNVPYRVGNRMLAGKLTIVAVGTEAPLAPVDSPTCIWVLAGKGQFRGGKEQALNPSSFALVPRSSAVRIAADPKSPLLLLVFRPELDDVSDIVKKQQKLYSQFNEELLIRDFFADKHDGTFLDVGAADYKRHSTTFFLEERLGWSGIAVDALAEHAKGFADHRPRTRFLNYLVGDKTRGTQKFYRAPRDTELSSTDRAVARDQELALRGDDKVDELQVPTITLDDLLAQQGMSTVDFMSMDIEDHEPEALSGFDINRFRPKLVCIEAHPTVADRIFRYFNEHGYQRIEKYLPYDTQNWYFTRR
jgi:FkbM family methyltransferase